MTRGKIMFIDEAGRYYQTLEFNGDMYPQGHGGTIIEKYEDGGIRSYSDSVSLLEDDSVDYTNNRTDYMHVVNGASDTREGSLCAMIIR